MAARPAPSRPGPSPSSPSRSPRTGTAVSACRSSERTLAEARFRIALSEDLLRELAARRAAQG